jgi:hypothetical protein
MSDITPESQRRPKAPGEQSYFVLFADLLGFKNIVLSHKLPKKENLDFRDPPRFARFKGGTLADLLGFASSSPLSETFIAFHGGIEQTYRDTSWSKPASLLVFSDSVFLATETLEDCFTFAERLMVYCLGQEAPIRMGIGYGSFLAYGFAFEDSPKLKYISSQFLGSAVIHATETEKCVNGLRIGVHDSVVETLKGREYADYKLLPLPSDEVKAGLNFEWNYFSKWSDNMYVPEYPELDAGQMKAILAHVEKMKKAAPQDDQKVQLKYVRTLEAIRRMGIAIVKAEEDPRFQPPPPFEPPEKV